MAELFLARVAGPQSFEKLVVVKKILPKYADHPRFVQLFNDEARLAASLSHKNIVAAHDIGGSAHELFFAMEYIHGQDVRAMLHRAWRLGQKLPIQHAVLIASQVASALHYAHEKRRPDGTLLEVVHRDVSPSNVLVSYEGVVKLVDFGVAKAATRTVKTRTGTLKGKIAYMSPEQAKGAPIDRRSDVFSLGILLWEMITTTRLFRAENDLATLQLIINQPIKKPTVERPDCPPELERIALKALAQDVAKRYQTANELAQDLEELVRSEQLNQSATGLSMYVRTLFRAELDSWEEARAQGTTLGEHLTQVGELTAPISESEFIEAIADEDLEEEEPEDDEDAPKAPPTVPGRRVSTPATPVRAVTGQKTPPPTPVRPSQPVIEAQAAVAAARGDATEHVAPLPPPAMVPRADTTPLPQRASNDSNPWPTTPTPHGGLAQGSWPQQANVVMPGDPNELPFSFEQAQKLKKQFLYVMGGIAALVFLIAIVKGGGGQPAEADQSEAETEAVREEPPAPVREAPPPPAKAEASPAPPAAVPVDAGVAAEPSDAAVLAEPPIDAAAPPAVAKPVSKKRPSVTKPTAKPAVTKPPVKPIRKFDPNAPIAPR